MKTAISITDELFNQAENLARRTGKSRSQLYREALSEYLNRRDSDELTSEMDAAVAAIEPQSDRWLAEAGRQALQRSEW